MLFEGSNHIRVAAETLRLLAAFTAQRTQATFPHALRDPALLRRILLEPPLVVSGTQRLGRWLIERVPSAWRLR